MSDTERRGGISRRQFLVVSAIAGGGALLVMSPLGRRAARKLTPKDPTIFVKILPDDSIVVTVSKSEMGQGVRTSLAMLVAEELDADWSKVKVETAPFDPKYGDQSTSGSASVLGRWVPLRQVGAAARVMLVAAAAKKLNVSRDELETRDSTVRHAKSGRSVTYGALADALTSESPPLRVELKPRSAWRILGKEQVGKDVSDITHGTARYGIDLRVPGLLFASIERPHEFGATVKTFDASAALAVPGVVKVVEIAAHRGSQAHPGVAVVAKNTWAALQGRRALEVEWASGPNANEDTRSHRAFMLDAVKKPGTELVNRIGEPDAMLARSSSVIAGEYEVPFIAHATMEPMNCTARVKGNRAEIWSPTQLPEWAARETASALGIPLENVTLHVAPLIGGGFGRRLNSDFNVEAALLAKQIEAPVQVLWTREDDLRHDFYRPCAVHRMEATLDTNGWPEAWRHRMCSAAIAGSSGRAVGARVGAGESNGAGDMSYRVPNRSSEFTLLESGVPRGAWRAIHTTHTTFATESFIDELAARAGKDPLEYRLALIDKYAVASPADNEEFPFKPERLKDVLRLAAEKAGWGNPLPAGHAHGIACAIDHLSYVAEVVEISMEGGKLKIHRIVVAADCGPVINPNGARAQLEGGVTQALSAALKERITISAGGVVQSNFTDYPLLRINEAPLAIEAHFVNREDEWPTGLGEPSVPPLAPAVANAIARLTGKRLRSLPFDLTGLSS